MKRKFWTLGLTLILGIMVSTNDLFAKGYSQVPKETAFDGRVEQNLADTERTHALLAIWKEHVQTVTKERDEAYKEIELLKGQEILPSDQTNAASEEILKEKEEALRQLNFLKDKMTLLQKKYDQLQAENTQNKKNRVDSVEVSALQAKAVKLEFVEKEFQEARDYFASYVKTLEAKYKKLENEHSNLKLESQKLQAEMAKQVNLEPMVTQLKSENDELQKIQVQQSKVINTLRSAIQSSLDSLTTNCGDSKKSASA